MLTAKPLLVAPSLSLWEIQILVRLLILNHSSSYLVSSPASKAITSSQSKAPKLPVDVSPRQAMPPASQEIPDETINLRRILVSPKHRSCFTSNQRRLISGGHILVLRSGIDKKLCWSKGILTFKPLDAFASVVIPPSTQTHLNQRGGKDSHKHVFAFAIISCFLCSKAVICLVEQPNNWKEHPNKQDHSRCSRRASVCQPLFTTSIPDRLVGNNYRDDTGHGRTIGRRWHQPTSCILTAALRRCFDGLEVLMRLPTLPCLLSWIIKANCWPRHLLRPSSIMCCRASGNPRNLPSLSDCGVPWC